MSSISRRRFLQGVTAVAGGAALTACAGGDPAPGDGAAPTSSSALADLAPATVGTVPGSTGGTLVVLTLAGGNDALNTVVPVGDPRYAERRGALALDPATTLDIGEGFALHPALARTKARFDAGQVAVVHGVGFAELDRSHFHCMDVWQAAGTDFSSGWVGRWLDRAGTDVLDAVAVDRRLPLLARGTSRAAAVVPPGPFRLPGDATLRAALTDLTGGGGDRPALAAAVAASTGDLLAVVDQVAPAVAASRDADTLADRLDTVATLMEAGMPTRVYATDLGGFDTHAAQAGQHESLLGQVDEAVATLLDRTAGRRVTVLVYTEFGRRVVPNNSAGTDHGKGGTALLLGDVRGGHHGDPPPLADLDDGDLRTTVDFRAVYGGLLEGVLGMPAADVIDRAPPPLALVPT